MEHLELELAIGLVALAVAAYALVAARLSRWSVSAAFSFLAIGTVIGWLATTMGAESMPGHEILGSLAELTLAPFCGGLKLLEAVFLVFGFQSTFCERLLLGVDVLLELLQVLALRRQLARGALQFFFLCLLFLSVYDNLFVGGI